MSSTAVRGVDDLVDKGVSKVEQIAGIKRRKEQSSEEQKKKRRKLETKNDIYNSLVQLMSKDE